MMQRTRRHKFSVWLSDAEKEKLDVNASLCGMGRSAYLRRLILGAEIRARPCAHHADVLRKLAGLCNNANQLAHTANSTGQAGAARVEEMLRIANAAFEAVQQGW